MITAVFTDNDDYAHAYGLWQWDYGQQLRIEGLHLPTAVEIHFALQETGGEAIPRVGTTKDGVTTVTIPDSMLEGNSTVWTADKMYNIHAWIYLSDRTSGETIKRITMQVKSRPKPEAFEAPGDGEIFREAIEAVNDAAKRAEEAGDKAVSAADEAKAAATQTAEHLEAVQGLAEQVETNADTVAQDKQAVTGMLSQAQQEASDAALSAQAAKLSETAAAQAQTGAEAAEDGARQYAEETSADRQAVADDKQAVSQMRESVAADRQAVEQTVTEFDGAAERAMQSIETASNTAVRAVTAEGDKQVQRIQDSVIDLAPAIHNTASGFVISADDAADGRPFRGLRMFGKSTQMRTTGAQLFDVTDVEMKTVLKMDGTTSPNGSIHTSGFIKVLPNETYSVSSTRQNRGKFYDINKRVLTTDKFDFELANSKDKFTTSEKTEYVRFSIYETESLDNVMVNAGDTLKPWEPYTGGKPSPSPEYKQEPEDAGKDGSIEVKVGGRNLFDGKFESGSIRQDNGENQDYADRIRTAGFIQIKPSTVYSIKLLETISFSVRWYDKDKRFIKSEATNTISQSPDNARYMRFLLLTTKLDTKCMVYAGSAPTPYEPYRDPQTLTLATPNGLPGIPVTKDGNYTDSNGQQWICDEIDLEKGKYVQRTAEKEVAEITWSGAGIWGNTDAYKTLGFYAYIDGSNINKDWGAVKNYGICNYATITSNVFNNSIIGFSLGDYIAFRVSRNLLPDWDENNPSNDPWVNWLKARKEAGNPVIVRYALKTPIERDLTSEEIAAYKALRTYGPTTVISNDVGAEMEVTYVADTKAYIDKKFKELNQAIVNTQIALL